MGISDDLSHYVLLGRNNPSLFELIQTTIKDLLAEGFAVTQQDTVAKKRQVEDQEEITDQSDLEDDLIGSDFDFPQSNLSLPSVIVAEADTADQS